MVLCRHFDLARSHSVLLCRGKSLMWGRAENETPRLITDAGLRTKFSASTSVVRNYGSALRSDGAQIGCRGLSAVGHNVERDFLSLIEIVHPGAFHGADVDEYVPTAVIRLHEAEALLALEPLYGSFRPASLLSTVYERSRFEARQPVQGRVWDKVVSPTHSARRGQVVRPKLDGHTHIALLPVLQRQPWIASCTASIVKRRSSKIATLAARG